MLSTNNIIEGSFCLYVVTYTWLFSLSCPNAWNRLRRNMFANSFGTLKQYFEVIELNKTLKAANR